MNQAMNKLQGMDRNRKEVIQVRTQKNDLKAQYIFTINWHNITHSKRSLLKTSTITRHLLLSFRNLQKATLNDKNGMLRHSYLRVGEDISLRHFIAPSFEFLLCFSVYLCTLFPVWLDVDSTERSRGMVIRPTNKGIKYKDIQTNRAKTQRRKQ